MTPNRAPTAAHRLIVTDSNRDQARQWRGSQDTRGFTESGGDGRQTSATFDSADQRLDVFEGIDANSQTVAVQTGPVTARASAYGELFAYRPEDRAAMAIDGDPTTAWRVADRFDAVGEFIELDAEQPARHDRASSNRSTGRRERHPTGGSRPWMSASTERRPCASTSTRRPRSSPGQTLALPVAGTTVRLTIAATAAEPGSGDGLVATGFDAVGFAEIDTGLGPSVEVTRPPIDWVTSISTTSPTSARRSGAHPTARRPGQSVAARSRTEDGARHHRAARPRCDGPGDGAPRRARADDRVIADLLGLGGATASERLTGMPTSGGWAATDDDPATAWITPFGRPIGPTLTVPVATTISNTVSTIELLQPTGDFSPITEVTVGTAGGEATLVACRQRIRTDGAGSTSIRSTSPVR